MQCSKEICYLGMNNNFNVGSENIKDAKKIIKKNSLQDKVTINNWCTVEMITHTVDIFVGWVENLLEY